MPQDASNLLISEFSKVEDYLFKTDADKAQYANLKTLAKISDESMQLIVNIGFEKFNEESYLDSHSLLLLTSLNPQFSEYWLWRGVAAQMSGKFELAILSYAVASELDSNLIVSRLLSAECYLNIGQRDKANEELLKAKILTETGQVEPEIIELFNSIESKINSSH